MRAYGSVTSLPAAGASDHVCWVHDDSDGPAFDAAVRTFLAGGLARAERLLCIRDRVIATVQAELDPLTDVDALVAAAQRRLELVRWEQLADQYVVQGPGMTAMCIYRIDLPADALADVASTHPVTRCPEGVPQFRVFFDDDDVVVAGSVDTFEAGRLARVLRDSPTVPAVRLDVSRLEFVDVAGCRVIARWAGERRGRGVDVEIRGASRLFRRVWQVLALSEVAPVAFAEAAA